MQKLCNAKVNKEMNIQKNFTNWYKKLIPTYICDLDVVKLEPAFLKRYSAILFPIINWNINQTREEHWNLRKHLNALLFIYRLVGYMSHYLMLLLLI